MRINERKSERGILLITLVITTIIILIFAAVAIAAITGENNLFSMTSNSADIYTMASRNEANELNTLVAKLDPKEEEEVWIQELWAVTEYVTPGVCETYTVLDSGFYQIELWGAAGGGGLKDASVSGAGGKGGYTSGKIYLKRGEKLYFYIGGKGSNGVVGKDVPGGYNGGGLGKYDLTDDETGGGGGGATDVRLVDGEWDNFDSLKSRIMVAAGGGGGCYNVAGGAGGGITGIAGKTSYSSGGTQTTGYKFGIGSPATSSGPTSKNGTYGEGGAGSGYYGGTFASHSAPPISGAGGSSFISGHTGCNAIAENSTETAITHTGQSVHYSGKKFLDTLIMTGNTSMPSRVGATFQTGNAGDGCAKITFCGKYLTENFAYTGAEQEFTVDYPGYYKIELWGASGGTGLYDGAVKTVAGKGGYTSGIIQLTKGEKLYFHVGGKGTNGVVKQDSAAAYNGGGGGTWDRGDNETGGGGGGATDVRLVSGAWNNFDSLKSRIMVAAGGGGSIYGTNGGDAGGLNGYTNRVTTVVGTQTSGYKFGSGESGTTKGSIGGGTYGEAGSGSGYYGGKITDHGTYPVSGSGGSSFISGYTGCDAISIDSTESNIIHTGQPVHYSEKQFINPEMKDGKSTTVPDITGRKTQTGNDGNGFARISYIGEKLES